MSMSAKQYVPLSQDELATMRAAARDHQIGAGLFFRALAMHAYATLTPDELTRVVDEEKAASKQRLSDGARQARSHRWTDKKDDDDG